MARWRCLRIRHTRCSDRPSGNGGACKTSRRCVDAVPLLEPPCSCSWRRLVSQVPQVPQVSQCRLRICRSVPLPLRSAARGTIWGSRCHQAPCRGLSPLRPLWFVPEFPAGFPGSLGSPGSPESAALPPGRPSGVRPPARSMVGGREGAVATSAHRRSRCYIARRRSAGHYTTTRTCRRHRCRRRSAGSRRNAGRCSDARARTTSRTWRQSECRSGSRCTGPGQCARQARSSHSRAQYSRVRTVLPVVLLAQLGRARMWRWVGDVVQVVAIRTCRSRCTPS